MAPKTVKELEKLIEDLKKAYEDFGKEIPLNLKKPINEITKYHGSIEKAYSSLDLQLTGVRHEIVRTESGLSGLKDRFTDISKELGRNYGDPYKHSLKSFEKLTRYAEDLSDIQYDLGANSLKDTNLLREKVNLEFRRLNTQVESLEVQKAETQKEIDLLGKNSQRTKEQEKELKALNAKAIKIEELQQFASEELKSLEEKVGYQDKFNEAIDKTYKRQKNVHNAIGLTGKLIGGLGNSLTKLGFGDLTSEIDIAKKKMSQLAIEITDNGNKAAGFVNTMKIGLTGLSSLGKSVLSSLSDPLVVITLMVKTIKGLISLVSEFKKGESEVGKAFGIAGKEAQNTYNTIRQSQDLYHFPDELLSGQKKYNEAVGFNLEYNKENAATMVDLTQYLGLSDEIAGKLLRRSELLGGSFKSNDKAMARITTEFNKQNKTAVPYSKVLNNIANASSAATFNIKGGVKGLTEAAAAATRYGRSIDDIKSSAESLLNFEDSISKELEAELLIGKDINLEKLRYAALTGDIKTQEAEQSRLIRENFKNLKGNVIAQKAFAASLGMELDTVAKIAEQQELEAKMTPAQLKAHQATLEAQAKQAKEAEAFNRQFANAINALKTALLPIIQGITPLFITMAEMAGKVANSLNSVGKFLSGDTGKMLMTILGVGAGGALLAVAGAKAANLVKGAKDMVSGGIFTPKKGATDEDKPGTKKKTLLERMMGGKGTLGDSKNNPLYVYVVNQGGGLFGDGDDDDGGGYMGGGRGGRTRGGKGSKRNKKNKRSKGGRGGRGGRGAALIGLASMIAPSFMSSDDDGDSYGLDPSTLLNIADAAINTAPSLSSTTAPKTTATRSISPRATSSTTAPKSGGFFSKLYEKGSNVLSKATKPLSSVKEIFKSPIVKGIGKALGPILALATSIGGVYSTIQDAKTQKAAGEKVDEGNLGKEIIKTAAYPIANLLTNLIPGVGTAISLSDGILGAFGLSPIKFITDNLIDLFPDDAFSGLGKLALGNNTTSTTNLSNNKTSTTNLSKKVSPTESLTPMKNGAVVSSPTPALIGEGGKEIALPLEKAPGIIAKTIEQSPSLVPFNNQSSNTPSYTTNNGKMEQIMSSILDTLNQINSKEGIINLDGSKVGTGLVMTNFRS